MKTIKELQDYYEDRIATLVARIDSLESRETAREVKINTLKNKAALLEAAKDDGK